MQKHPILGAKIIENVNDRSYIIEDNQNNCFRRNRRFITRSKNNGLENNDEFQFDFDVLNPTDVMEELVAEDHQEQENLNQGDIEHDNFGVPQQSPGVDNGMSPLPIVNTDIQQYIYLLLFPLLYHNIYPYLKYYV